MERGVSVEIDGKEIKSTEGITVKSALVMNGYKVLKGSLFTPCEVGGCWSCAVLVNGTLSPSCTTRIKDKMTIETDLPNDYTPKRIIQNFGGHMVGGVGTPWQLKKSTGYIEVACFAAGCNLLCPQCQNWDITYKGNGVALTPRDTAEIMSATRKRFSVDRMAISGGESSLNRKWLIEYIKELKRLNPDPAARIHVDTNASILTRDYIDELIDAGMTDIGPDLKGYSPETFMRISGIEDKDLAEMYLSTAWDAVRYLIENHKENIFIGVGIPYNRAFISPQEIEIMGEKLSDMDSEIQVCVLDYRPEFRRTEIIRPSYHEMLDIQNILKRKGLKTVICQTEFGHIEP
ncbi:MAG: radical SAM protein [Thermodesulfobacteriota bacterium]|nr:radical SAM protein [Thermodesulfobacteriota bacterium]